jgi:hypothetical protein
MSYPSIPKPWRVAVVNFIEIFIETLRVGKEVRS